MRRKNRPFLFRAACLGDDGSSGAGICLSFGNRAIRRSCCVPSDGRGMCRGRGWEHCRLLRSAGFAVPVRLAAGEKGGSGGPVYRAVFLGSGDQTSRKPSKVSGDKWIPGPYPAVFGGDCGRRPRQPPGRERGSDSGGTLAGGIYVLRAGSGRAFVFLRADVCVPLHGDIPELRQRPARRGIVRAGGGGTGLRAFRTRDGGTPWTAGTSAGLEPQNTAS